MLGKLAKYNKFWVALAAAISILIFCMAPTDTEPAFYVSLNEWYQVLVAGAAAFGVYRAPNRPAY